MSRSLFQRIQDGAGKYVVGAPPERTLYVAQAPSGSPNLTYPSNFFTTIQAAINAGAALTPAPSAANPVAIVIYPGTYTENLVLKPFVYLFGVTQTEALVISGKPVIVSGTWSYTSVSAVSEDVSIGGIRITGAGTVDTSGNTGGAGASCRVVATQCFFDGALSFTGRAGFPANDSLRTNVCRLNNLTFSNALGIFFGGTIAGTTTGNNASSFILANAVSGSTVVLNGTSTYSQDSGSVSNLTANNGTSADIRGVWKQGSLASAGTGAINRGILNASTGALGAGAQVVTYTVPFKDANYNVQLVQTAGAATAVPVVTAKAAGSFTVTVPAGGATYDYTVVHN